MLTELCAMKHPVLVERRSEVTIVSIRRPDRRNAVDGDTARALASAFVDFDEDDHAAVAILTGCEGVFCAGADLKAVAADEGANLLVDVTGHAHDRNGPMGPTRLQLSKPVIAAIAGPAVAGGLELALWCDLRVAEQSAILGVFCRRWGVPLIDGGTVRLPRLIGHSRAMDLILTGRPVGAEEALGMGLVNRVVEDGTGLEAAVALAREIARFPQACLRSDRHSALQQWDLSLAKALELEFQSGKQIVESGESAAGAQRFSEGKGRSGDFESI